MIEVSHLTKKYGQKIAVNDLSFTIPDGEIVGFLGPNGAGKSTTMNILTGYLSPTSGTASFNGFDIYDNANECKKQIGYLPEQPPVYFDMTVKDYLDFVYDLKKCDQKRNEHLAEIMEVVKIKDVYNRIIGNLSKGYKQRVGLAQALIGNPSVLILDEPTVGLDPKEIIEIRSLIKRLGKSRTVILSSHILPEVQAVCERLLVIADGKLVADGTPNDLSNDSTIAHRLSIRVAGPASDVKKLIKSINGIRYCEETTKIESDAHDFIIESEPNIDVRRMLFNELAKKNWPLLSSKPLDATLEDAFIRLVDSPNNKVGGKKR